MVKIAVTGHRILAEPERLVAGDDVALAAIKVRFPSDEYCILSSLAEGADRIAVNQCRLKLNAELWVVLPMSEELYAEDFGVESRQEFFEMIAGARSVEHVPSSTERLEMYASAGRYVVDRCDVLIAVWDGLPA